MLKMVLFHLFQDKMLILKNNQWLAKTTVVVMVYVILKLDLANVIKLIQELIVVFSLPQFAQVIVTVKGNVY